MADNSNLIVSALRKTNPQLADAIDAGNSWQTGVIRRGARVKLYRDYERGDHRADMTNQMRDMLRLKSDDAELKDLNVNYCKIVIDKMAGRLHVSNIVVDEQAQDWLEETLKRNDFSAVQSMWYRGAIRDGDSYIIVDPKTLYWSAEPAYDGFSGVISIFDAMTRKPVWACKMWSEADSSDAEDNGGAKMKLVVYQPGVVSYWVGEQGGAEVSPADTPDTISTEQPNYKKFPIDNLPVIPIVNQLDNYTQHGESEIRVVIPLQDALNRTQYSKIMASEFSAFNLLWSIGFEIDVDGITPGGVVNLVLKDAGGNIITDMTEEQLAFLNAAKVGQFAASDISQYTNQIDKEAQQISQVSQTPIYGVTAQGNLSGEALKQLEVGLIGKVERFQRQNDDAIKELVNLTAQMQREFDTDVSGSAPDITGVSVIWKSPEILDVNARIQTLTQLREKAPDLLPDSWYIKRIGILLGMDQKEIADIIEESKNNAGLFFEAVTGGGGGIPVA